MSGFGRRLADQPARSRARNQALYFGVDSAPRGEHLLPDPAGPTKGAISKLNAHRRERIWDLKWFESVAEISPFDQPRVLIRVDEFPCATALDAPETYGTARAAEFHSVLAASGVDYLMAALPEPASNPLDPGASGGRRLGTEEVELLRRMADDGVVFAQHGKTHRTRHRSPRRRSEFTGLSPADLGNLLDEGADALSAAGIDPTRIMVPPFNRFSATQLPVFAERFEVLTGGPESVRFMGGFEGPCWIGDLVYVPTMPPLYARAREIVPLLRRLAETARGVWIPITLHLSWELDDGLTGLRELAAVASELSVSWNQLLDAVDASRAVA